jgi:hypothetical protein
VHEAHHKDHGAPLLVGFHLFEEVLVYNSGESTRDTSLETFWRLSSNLDGHLQETQRECRVLLASDPETEIFVDLFILGVKDFFHLAHELEGQVAIV